MGNFVESFHHFVWATRKREWFITEEIEPHLHRYLRHKCQEMGVHLHALNGMPDHVHLVVSLPMSLAPADFLETIKGTSAHFVNHVPGLKGCLYWQPGYGALTFAAHDFKRVARYVDRQKAHHGSGGRLSEKMERMDDGWSEGQKKPTR